MAHESLYQTVGGASFPAKATDITDGLQALEPIRDRLLAFFEAAINAEVGGAWAQAVASTCVPGLSTSPVGLAVPMLPSSEVLQQEKVAWPALFLARDLSDQRNRFEPYSLWIDKQVQIWSLTYLLPPLSVIGRRKLEDILLRVAQVCHLAIRNMRHPAYESGAYWMQPAGLHGLQLVGFRSGEAKFNEEGGPTYLAMTMTLETVEIGGHVEGSVAPLDHLSITAGTGNVEGIIPNLIEGTTDKPVPVPPPP